jgi:hypothetical protein
MSIFQSKYDPLEKMIFEENLKIHSVDFKPEMDVMLVFLNTKAILQLKISNYEKLRKAPKTKLSKFELIADGTGIHWPLLDEDLSLKGFLNDFFKAIVKHEQTLLTA